ASQSEWIRQIENRAGIVNGELPIGLLHDSQSTIDDYASCPVHKAPLMLSRVAPVTDESTLYSCLHRSTPMNAMIIASLYLMRFSSGTNTLTFKFSNTFSSRFIKKIFRAPPPVTRSREP